MTEPRPALLFGLLAGLVVTLAPSATPAQTVTDDAAQRTGYAHLIGIIDRMRHRYLRRVVEAAREQSLDTLIVHIDTDGGEVSHAREMFKLVIDQMRDGPRMIAYVDFRAISAGAMIAYAHESIYMAEASSIGDIGVIFVGQDGEIKYAPEKIETVVRTLLVQAAEQRGWDRALLLKMTARNQKLYRVERPGHPPEYVIEDDLPDFLSRHPEVDKEDERQLVLYRGEDRLLTLTGKEAVGFGMATGIAADVDALYAQLGIDPSTVVDLSPGTAETTAWYLATVAPMLAGLAFLFILLELKTPGVGWWAIIGAVLAGLFLLAQYYLDMAENIEVVLVAVGILLLATELLTMVGGGLLGVAGGLLSFTGLLMLFLPNELEFDFSDSTFMSALGDAAINTFITFGVMATGLLAFIAILPRTSIPDRLAVHRTISGTSAGEIERNPEAVTGRTGVVREALRPSGTIVIDGLDHSARAEQGTYIGSNVEVTVIAVQFGELIVRRLAETASGN